MVKKSTRKGVITRPRHEDRSDEGYGFECGVDYVLSMMGISNSNRALISKRMAARAFDIPTRERRSVAATKPVQLVGCNDAELEAWVREELVSVGWDKHAKRGRQRQLLIKEAAVKAGSRVTRVNLPLRQLIEWAKLFASQHVEVRFELESNLGLYATMEIEAGMVVASAVVDHDPDVVRSHCQTMGKDGSWLGPAALVNAACAKHANAWFRERGGLYAVVTTRRIRMGEQILVPYEQDGAGACLICKVPLNRMSVDIDTV